MVFSLHASFGLCCRLLCHLVYCGLIDWPQLFCGGKSKDRPKAISGHLFSAHDALLLHGISPVLVGLGFIYRDLPN
jgi:hypothetical protein